MTCRSAEREGCGCGGECRAEVSRLSEALERAVRKSGGLKMCPVCDGEWLLNVGDEPCPFCQAKAALAESSRLRGQVEGARREALEESRDALMAWRMRAYAAEKALERLTGIDINDVVDRLQAGDAEFSPATIGLALTESDKALAVPLAHAAGMTLSCWALDRLLRCIREDTGAAEAAAWWAARPKCVCGRPTTEDGPSGSRFLRCLSCQYVTAECKCPPLALAAPGKESETPCSPSSGGEGAT